MTAMIVVLSVMDGFESEMKKRMMSSDLHILVQPTDAVPGFDSGFVPQDALGSERIETIKKQARGEVESLACRDG